jgi:hypothetical protein
MWCLGLGNVKDGKGWQGTMCTIDKTIGECWYHNIALLILVIIGVNDL